MALIVVMVLSIAACGSTSDETPDSTGSNGDTTASEGSTGTAAKNNEPVKEPRH